MLGSRSQYSSRRCSIGRTRYAQANLLVGWQLTIITTRFSQEMDEDELEEELAALERVREGRVPSANAPKGRPPVNNSEAREQNPTHASRIAPPRRYSLRLAV